MYVYPSVRACVFASRTCLHVMHRSRGLMWRLQVRLRGLVATTFRPPPRRLTKEGCPPLMVGVWRLITLALGTKRGQWTEDLRENFWV